MTAPADATTSWDLVERCQAGDTAAFGEVYDRYVDVVFRFVARRVGNRQTAEDLTADTFVRALRRIDGLEWQGHDLGAWLVTIARNLVADYFKSARYRLETPTDVVADVDRVDESRDNEPALNAVAGSDTAALLAAIGRLRTAEQRQVVCLRFFEDMPHAQIAAVMGRDASAVKAMLWRALCALRRDGVLVALMSPDPTPVPPVPGTRRRPAAARAAVDGDFYAPVVLPAFPGGAS